MCIYQEFPVLQFPAKHRHYRTQLGLSWDEYSGMSTSVEFRKDQTNFAKSVQRVKGTWGSEKDKTNPRGLLFSALFLDDIGSHGSVIRNSTHAIYITQVDYFTYFFMTIPIFHDLNFFKKTFHDFFRSVATLPSYRSPQGGGALTFITFSRLWLPCQAVHTWGGTYLRKGWVC